MNNKYFAIIALSYIISFSTAASANTMLGAYVKYDGWSLSSIDKFNTDSSKTMAITSLYTNFDRHWNHLGIQSSNIVSRGSTPMINLMPYSARHSDMLSAISSGAEDVYIDSWISSFKAWRNSYPEGQQPVILLRFGHEFNGNWYPWGNRPTAFKAAWRHIHAMFEAAGANEGVEWVWSANSTDVDDYNDIRVYYPGADVVDWTSLDGYNWGTNYVWSSWRNFDQVFSYAYNRLIEYYPEKPIIIAEVASAEPNDLPDPAWGQFGSDNDANQCKEKWVADMLTRIEESYPAIRAITWFNINKEVSWALNGTAKKGLLNTGLGSYKTGVKGDYFKSDFARFGHYPLSQQTISTQSKVSVKKPVIAGFFERLLDILTEKAHANQLVIPEKNNPAKTLSKKQLKQKASELQRALAMSKKPEVAGEKLRAQEAAGMKKMAKKHLRKISEARLQLGQPQNHVPEQNSEGFYFDLQRY